MLEEEAFERVCDYSSYLYWQWIEETRWAVTNMPPELEPSEILSIMQKTNRQTFFLILFCSQSCQSDHKQLIGGSRTKPVFIPPKKCFSQIQRPSHWRTETTIGMISYNHRGTLWGDPARLHPSLFGYQSQRSHAVLSFSRYLFLSIDLILPSRCLGTWMYWDEDVWWYISYIWKQNRHCFTPRSWKCI